MEIPRRYVLGGLLVVLTVVAAALLSDVIGTVFFAVTVAYLLVPLREELVRRGIDDRVATVVVTFAALVGVIAVVAPLVFLTASRLTETLALLSTLPSTYDVDLFGRVFTIHVADLRASMVEIVRTVGRQLLVSLPVLLVKFTLFVFLVYSLLQQSGSLSQSLLAVVPPNYRRVAKALNRRARNTLFGIYILQAATALGTFAIALPVFLFLGYDSIITLSTVAAILQFIPIVGPSLLLLVVAIFHVAAGEITRALLILVFGGFFVAWLPDILIRPRLSKRAANLSGGVYFIGFVGGLLSMGALGIIAGPLIVALVVEAAGLVSEEFNDVPVEEL